MLCPVGRCAKRNVFISFLLLCSAVLLNYSVIASQSVTLGWDTSSDPNVAGYNVYYGMVSHQYTNEVSAGNKASVVISGLTVGMTYYFAATTYDIFDQESSFSDETPYTVPITLNCVVGQNVFLNVLAGQFSPLIFQWRFDSMDIPFATNRVLTLNNITANQAGTYSVNVSDDAGMTTNLTLYLSVYPTTAATLTPANIAGGPFSFNISGVPGFRYIVQSSTNLMDWEFVQTNNAPFVFTDPDVKLYSRRFYRTLSANGSAISFSVGARLLPWPGPLTFGQPDVDQF
jgi:Fibronectin type III domain